MFVYENRLVFPIYISDEKFKGSMELHSMNLLLLIDDDKSRLKILTYLFH